MIIHKIVSDLVSKWNVLLKKHSAPVVVYDKLFNDQLLREIQFADGHCLSIYPPPIHPCCTCNESFIGEIHKLKRCRHEKYIFDKYIQNNPIEGGETQNKNIDDNQSVLSTSSENDMCLICLQKIELESKYITCQYCHHKEHKSCWKQWQIARYNLKKKHRSMSTNCDECIQCRNHNKGKKGFVDNEGILV